MILFSQRYINSTKCEITLALAVSHYPLGCVWWSRGLWDLFWLESAAQYLLLTATAAACPRYICCCCCVCVHASVCDCIFSCVIICMCQLHVSFVSAKCECARAFVSHSMRVLDGSCGFAVVVISLRVGWTNLSIQFLPLVFSPMREPSRFPLHSISVTDKTLLSETP